MNNIFWKKKKILYELFMKNRKIPNFFKEKKILLVFKRLLMRDYWLGCNSWNHTVQWPNNKFTYINIKTDTRIRLYNLAIRYPKTEVTSTNRVQRSQGKRESWWDRVAELRWPNAGTPTSLEQCPAHCERPLSPIMARWWFEKESKIRSKGAGS